MMKFILYPGYLWNGSEFKYVSFDDMIDMYNLNQDEVCDLNSMKSTQDWSGHKLLYPKNHKDQFEYENKSNRYQTTHCGRWDCHICGEWSPSTYLVKDSLWDSVVPSSKIVLCWTCFEKLIGRNIVFNDLPDVPINRIYRELLNRINN